MKNKSILFFILIILLSNIDSKIYGHGVDIETKAFLLKNNGAAFVPFMYIGAKHMITGYDHLLFLIGIIFFLYRLKEVITYVSFFTLGHSITLLVGVLSDITINPFVIDAIIALSIVYKGFDNLKGFKQILGYQPNTKVVVLIFGLFHGFGLASKLQEFNVGKNGLIVNLLGFNIGVEIGQAIALIFVMIFISAWRRHASFIKFSSVTNSILMAAGFILLFHQLTGYFTS